MSVDDQAPEPVKTRRVSVRTGSTPFGDQYRTMSVPEDVAGQWDDEQWHSAPPGV